MVPTIWTVWFVEEKTSCSCRWRRGGSSYDSCVIHPFSAWIVGDALRQGWRTYGARKVFLGSRHVLLASVFLFISLDQRLCILKNICTYTHICLRRDCVWITVAIITVSETFWHKSVAVWSVDWIFVIGAPAWPWPDQYVTLDKTFYTLLFKPEVVAAPVTSIFSSLSHSSRRPLLEIQ